MTDREMLELAAKAAGMHHPDGWDWLVNDLGFKWNPLEDDGDAFRLAVKLNISTDISSKEIDAFYHMDYNTFCKTEPGIKMGADPAASTRRAIVRAAVEIGKSMK